MVRSVSHIVCPHCTAVNRIPPDRPAQRARCGTCKQALFLGKPFDVVGNGFERHRSRNGIPIVVDFWAPWCGPCRAMAPAYERAAAELEPHYRLLKVNTEEEPALAARFGIRSIPTLMMFVRGERAAAQTAGAMNTSGIVDWVTREGAAHRS